MNRIHVHSLVRPETAEVIALVAMRFSGAIDNGLGSWHTWSSSRARLLRREDVHEVNGPVIESVRLGLQ